MNLFIGNISTSTSREDLENEFSKFGKCEIEFFKRFAFCNYKSTTAAAEAMKAWNGQIYKDNTLKVEFSQTKNTQIPQKRQRSPDVEEKKYKKEAINKKESLIKENTEKIPKPTEKSPKITEKSPKMTDKSIKITEKSPKMIEKIAEFAQSEPEKVEKTPAKEIPQIILTESISIEDCQEIPNTACEVNKEITESNFLQISEGKGSKTPPNSPNVEELLKEVNENVTKSLNTPKSEEKFRKSPQKLEKYEEPAAEVMEIVQNSQVESLKNSNLKDNLNVIDDMTFGVAECLFKYTKKLKNFEESTVQCEKCGRKLKCKSILAHLKSKIHQNL